jgi:hypothetical protein
VKHITIQVELKVEVESANTLEWEDATATALIGIERALGLPVSVGFPDTRRVSFVENSLKISD